MNTPGQTSRIQSWQRSWPALWLVLCAMGLVACGGPPAEVRTAQRLLRQGDYVAAERTAEQGFQRHPDHAELWRVQIQAAFGQGQAERGVALYGQWQRRHGGHDLALVRRLAMTTLWQGLRVPSAQVRAHTIQAIERLELEALAREVMKRLGDEDDLVAAAAAVAVLRAHPDAPDAITQLLHSDDPAARLVAIEGIARKIGAPAHADLVPALGDPDPAVRRAAIRALAPMKERGDVARFLTMARSDPDGPVRAEALAALARHKLPAAQDVARQALADAYLGARLAAIDVLAAGGDLASVRRAASATDPAQIEVAVHAALVVRDPVLLEAAIRRALEQPGHAVQQAALNAVHRLAQRDQAIQLAAARLAHQSWPVRLAAARALLYLGARAQAMAVLTEAAGAASEQARLLAALELLRLGEPRGVQLLIALGKSRDPATRERVVRAHAVARPESAGARITPALLAALADESAVVRITAAEVVLDLLP